MKAQSKEFVGPFQDDTVLGLLANLKKHARLSEVCLVEAQVLTTSVLNIIV